ncbi:MAG: hypothetical protein JWR38_4751 [Mucilaginibacter sp.]|nr:hypothetical protein [Mucilaginibacter sp.]
MTMNEQNYKILNLLVAGLVSFTDFEAQNGPGNLSLMLIETISLLNVKGRILLSATGEQQNECSHDNWQIR